MPIHSAQPSCGLLLQERGAENRVRPNLTVALCRGCSSLSGASAESCVQVTCSVSDEPVEWVLASVNPSGEDGRAVCRGVVQKCTDKPHMA